MAYGPEHRWTCPVCHAELMTYTAATLSRKIDEHKAACKEKNYSGDKDDQLIDSPPFDGGKVVPYADKIHKLTQADVAMLRKMKIRMNFGEDYD
jgi:hypothetical protein